MKKFIAIVMIIAMLTGFSGCSKGKTEERSSGETESSYNIEELQQNEGRMLEVRRFESEIREEFISYVTYDGYACNPSPVEVYPMRMTDDDYLAIYRFCVDSVENDPFADYSEDVCDGTTYSFIFYDEDGNPHQIYDGYIYENELLRSIVDIIARYHVD